MSTAPATSASGARASPGPTVASPTCHTRRVRGRIASNPAPPIARAPSIAAFMASGARSTGTVTTSTRVVASSSRRATSTSTASAIGSVPAG